MLTSRERYKIWYGAIAGGSFVALTQLITRDVFYWSHSVAIACFAFALPIATLFATWPDKYRQTAPPLPLRTLLDEFARTCSLVFAIGVTALFWSLGFIFPLIFLASCMVALKLTDAVTKHYEKQSVSGRGDQSSGRVTSASSAPNAND